MLVGVARTPGGSADRSKSSISRCLTKQPLGTVTGSVFLWGRSCFVLDTVPTDAENLINQPTGRGKEKADRYKLGASLCTMHRW